MRVAIDTGGTFTDCVYLRDGELRVLKLFSTPENPARAVLDALVQLEPGAQPVIRHGTTVGTNTMLERTGARAAFVTTRGFEDTIALGRQARARLYDWFQRAPAALVPAELRFGVKERTSAEGEILASPSAAELDDLVDAIRASGAESVALSFLFGFANPANEVTVAAALERLGIPISVAHRILPEFREYERASTIVTNAYLAPIMERYLTALQDGVASRYAGSRVEVMQSSGGIVPARTAAREPVRTVLSGPAGGVIGAYQVARLAGYDRIIGFDMGGTSTDVCLIDGSAGGPRISNEAVVSGIPLAVPMLDIHTVGAGGGSIARFDAGGLLRVGPESAGAEPGPICFGRGNLPTVTDANLILGRVGAERFLGGTAQLDAVRTREYMLRAKGSLATVEAFASGILRLVESSMEKAIRVISVERGHDPRRFVLVAFGGGGPLHAAALARALGIPTVLVPRLPGALSAVGILFADAVRDYSLTVMLPAEAAELEPHFQRLEERGHRELGEDGLEGIVERSADLRYRGQGFELNVPFGNAMLQRFHALHRKQYGFSDTNRPAEVVNLRVRLIVPAEPLNTAPQPLLAGDGGQAVVGRRNVFFADHPHVTRLYDRERLRPGDELRGPAVIEEYSSSTLLAPGDSLQVDERENLRITIGESEVSA